MQKPKDLENLTDEELIEEYEQVHSHHHKRKKITLFVTIFSVLLILSYFYITFPVYGILFGQIESQKINENTITSKNVNIVFLNQTHLKVFDTYSKNKGVETTLCMQGTINQNTYFIEQVYTPTIYSQSFRHVTHAPCSDDTIAMFHTHPYKQCVASNTDIKTLRKNQETNPEIIMIIMCQEDRFSIYN